MQISELRYDPLSNDWVVIAYSRRKRPEFFISSETKEIKKRCPFCDLNNLRRNSLYESENVIIVPNLYPAFSFNQKFKKEKTGPFFRCSGVGSHEVIILKNHKKQLFEYKKEELKELFLAFISRIKTLNEKKQTRYVSIFLNHREEAGASIPHPHAQLISIPELDEGYLKIFNGGKRYFAKYKKCFFCQMLKWEKKEKKRIVYENKNFIAICPFISRTNFDVRIYPKKHCSHFEQEKNLLSLGEILKAVLYKLNQALRNPSYNLILTNSPFLRQGRLEGKNNFFHWHFLILPKTILRAGFEFSTHMEILTVFPREAAEYLRKFKSQITDAKLRIMRKQRIKQTLET